MEGDSSVQHVRPAC